MPHEVSLFVRAFGHNEPWLLNRLHTQRAQLHPDDHREELLDSQMGDVLTQLGDLTRRTARSGPGLVVRQLADDLQDALDNTQQPLAPALRQPYQTMLGIFRAELAERAARRAPTMAQQSLGVWARQSPRGSAHEGGLRRGLLYWGRVY